MENLRQWKVFADAVADELNKAAKADVTISELVSTFNSLYKGEVVKNFKSLQETIQKIKDAYFDLMQEAATNMASKYTQVKKDAEAILQEITSLPSGLNEEAHSKTRSLLQYAVQRTSALVDIDYDVKDKQTRFTYSEMLSFIQLYNRYKTELEIIHAGLIKKAPEKPKAGEPDKPTKKTYNSTLPGKKVLVSKYKTWLQQELQKLAGAADNDEIEIN